MAAEALIAVDWGTTNRRAYRVERDGRTSASLADDCGITALAAEAFPQEIAQLRDRLGDLPVYMAGMVGSNRGWIEVPYAPCPAGLADLRSALCWVEAGRTAIVPGLSLADAARPDVMRGEETQAFGALAAGLIGNNALLCHPGTHCKWAEMRNGRLTRFHTAMTGEMFSLLAEHSILAPQLAAPVAVDASFSGGVEAALGGADLLSSLFAVRARAALHQPDPHAASWVSGLLIGLDVRAALAHLPGGVDSVAIIGSAELAALYTAAINMAGRRAEALDAAHCFTAGIAAIAWGST